MYLKDFEIRWNDLDANRHLANSSYVNFMSHTRMGFMGQLGMGHNELVKYGLAPVALYEHLYYFKEVLPGENIKVSLELKGMSEEGTFFEFHHNFYNGNGKNVAHCEMMGAWIDINKRALTPLPQKIFDIYNSIEKPEDFRCLSKEDTRKFAKVPKDLA
jgi:acyl-CoA thioester hydrolase